MNPKITIREETQADDDPIHELTTIAFADMEVSDHTEQHVIRALRAAGALSLSLVAELDGRVVGHIAFSPISISDGTRDWYGVGPISVLPEFQRQGIGSALIREGLEQLRPQGAKGCCLVGHPDYYPRFGFIHSPGLWMEGVPSEVFFSLSFDGCYPEGAVTFHEGFLATSSG